MDDPDDGRDRTRRTRAIVWAVLQSNVFWLCFVVGWFVGLVFVTTLATVAVGLGIFVLGTAGATAQAVGAAQRGDIEEPTRQQMEAYRGRLLLGAAGVAALVLKLLLINR